MVKDQDLTVYTFEIKWPSIMPKFVCLSNHMTIQSSWCRLPQIYILYFELINQLEGKKEDKTTKNNDADTMDGNTLLPVNQKA